MRKNLNNIFWGIMLLGLGVLLFGNALDVWNINVFFDGWWSLFIIVPSAFSIINNGSIITGVSGVLIGVLFLLSAQNVVTLSVEELILPTILIVIGIKILNSLFYNNNKVKKIEIHGKTNHDYVAVFSGQEVNYPSEKFEGADVFAMFGGVKLNLSKAKIEKDVVINARVIFGGFEVIVPENIQVEYSSSIKTFKDEKENKQEQSKGTPTIYINGFSAFGGIEVK